MQLRYWLVSHVQPAMVRLCVYRNTAPTFLVSLSVTIPLKPPKHEDRAQSVGEFVATTTVRVELLNDFPETFLGHAAIILMIDGLPSRELTA